MSPSGRIASTSRVQSSLVPSARSRCRLRRSRSTTGARVLAVFSSAHSPSSQRWGVPSSCSKRHCTRRDLPIPGSPDRRTVRVDPACASATSPEIVACSVSRPMTGAGFADTARPVGSMTRTTSHVWIGRDTPFSSGNPRSTSSTAELRPRRTSSLISTVPGRANPSRRAAMFGVTPNSDVSARSALPMAPTTVGPAWMPMRASSRTPNVVAHSALSCSRPSRIARPARTARSASSSWATGIAEVHVEPVAEVLRDLTAEAVHGRPAHLLVAQDDVAEVLRIELLGQRGRAHQVREEDRQPPPLTGGRRLRPRRARDRIGRGAARSSSAAPQPAQKRAPGAPSCPHAGHRELVPEVARGPCPDDMWPRWSAMPCLRPGWYGTRRRRRRGGGPCHRRRVPADR